MKKKERGKKERIALVYRSRWFSPSLGKGRIEKEKEWNGGKGRQYCDARRKLGRNFDGRSDDDEAGPSYFHELEEDMIAKLPFELSCVNLYLEYMLKKVTLLSLQLHLMIFSIMFHKNNIFLLWKISVRNRKS